MRLYKAGVFSGLAPKNSTGNSMICSRRSSLKYLRACALKLRSKVSFVDCLRVSQVANSITLWAGF